MLKALELQGFKSFADKSRFEFPAGITVVVGPNGSGKSNVVDAMKWVLGEQSAKSLRGQDMADVIFKGAGTGGRKPANSAEVTIVFDNADRRLPVDAPEVHITRRVYRSGEGEYLINRQPCRLKDIKDLLRGTGVGGDSYSLIEQGKVERLLQASAKDRRAMFEEAAGISRFKAKKIEAQRRLERVDQNLLRLSDIVEEVESRVRSVRAQAAKARRYREYSERLQELRVQVGRSDFRRLTEKLDAAQQELQRLRDEAAAAQTLGERLEAESIEVEAELSNVAGLTRELDVRMARCREQIVQLESAADQQRQRGRDLDEETHRQQQHLGAISLRAGDLQQRLREVLELWEQAESHQKSCRAAAAEHDRQAAELTRQLDELRGENDQRRLTYVAQMRAAAALGTEASGHRSQLAALAEATQLNRQRLDQIEQAVGEQSHQVVQLESQLQQLVETVADHARRLEDAQRDVAENRRVHARRQQEVAQMSGVLAGLNERSHLLQDWEDRLEGVGSGAKEALELARQGDAADFRGVRGLVADLLQANIEMAPLVDVALGDVAQYVAVVGDDLIAKIADGGFRPSSRVGFVRLDVPAAPPDSPNDSSLDPGRSALPPELDAAASSSNSTGDGAGDPAPPAREETDAESPLVAALAGQVGVLGRADQMVETAAEFRPLVRRLLGSTWFVADLTTALALRAGPGRGLRFVTLAGQLLEADGTVVCGPRLASSGLVSRRSELRDLQRRIAVLERQLHEGRREVQRLQENIDQQDRKTRQMAEEHQRLSQQASDQQVRTRTAQARLEQLRRDRETFDSQWQASQQQHAAVTDRLESAAARLTAVEQDLAALEARLGEGDRRVEQLEAGRQQAARQATAAHVELAKSEQRLETLRAQREQCERDEHQRGQALQDVHAQLRQAAERRLLCERTLLRGASELAELYWRKDLLAAELRDFASRREQAAASRSTLAERLQAQRRTIRQLEDRQHSQELAAGEIRHERQTLCDRLREDYGVETAELERPVDGESPAQRDEVENEIASLRKKIGSIGAVNMDALAELDELESRYNTLTGQHSDLKQAKEALERIIQKINADSRRLFLETLETIRANFQLLYRRAFGGGRADIVLEEGVDVLEGGVEILATPPGKPSFNNSLLSGGEKALTAVALLLAIFQFRPSPFCVLDEVDAPFDEANIGRFVDVLREFLSFTKFIIVTHSKKTMTAANTLYGITMQESGVSKRVSVRFEDVSEDGHISAVAAAREPDEIADDPLAEEAA